MNVSSVAERPNTMPSGTTPNRSPIAARASWTIRSARRSAGVTAPRLATADVNVVATASATTSGVWVPPGPSKWAAPSRSAGKCERTAATS